MIDAGVSEFAARIAATLVPWFSAIAKTVSPATTVCVPVVADFGAGEAEGEWEVPGR